MGHSIEVFIGQTDQLKAGFEKIGHAHVLPLEQGFAMVPVTNELHDEIVVLFECPIGHPHEEFWKLTEGMAAFGRQLSDSMPVAYLETDYFGGAGTQAAIAWQDGRIILGPQKTENEKSLAAGAINKALQQIGVARIEDKDAFDSLRLGRHRSNEAWLNPSMWDSGG